MFSYPTAHTQQSTVPPGVAEHNVTVARAFTKLMGAFVTFWDNDAGSTIHLLANPEQDVAPIGAARQEDSLVESQMQLGSLQYPPQPYEESLRGPTTTRCATSTSTALATCATALSPASRRSECPKCRSVASALVRAAWLGSPSRRSTAR